MLGMSSKEKKIIEKAQIGKKICHIYISFAIRFVQKPHRYGWNRLSAYDLA